MDKDLIEHVDSRIDIRLQEMENRIVATVMSGMEEKIFAKLGRWAWAGAGGLTTVVVIMATNWFSHENRLSVIESWKQERVEPINQYYEKMEEFNTRVSSLEGKLDTILKILTEKQQ